MKKSALSILMCLVMVLGFLPVFANAASPVIPVPDILLYDIVGNEKTGGTESVFIGWEVFKFNQLRSNGTIDAFEQAVKNHDISAVDENGSEYWAYLMENGKSIEIYDYTYGTTDYRGWYVTDCEYVDNVIKFLSTLMPDCTYNEPISYKPTRYDSDKTNGSGKIVYDTKEFGIWANEYHSNEKPIRIFKYSHLWMTNQYIMGYGMRTYSEHDLNEIGQYPYDCVLEINTSDHDTFRVIGQTDGTKWIQKIHFSDVWDYQWFFTAVEYLTDTGMINGYSDGTFKPFNRLTFSALCKMIYMYDNPNASALSTTGYWAAPYIEYCVNKGYFKSHGEITPANYDIEITREEAITGIMKCVTKGMAIETHEIECPDLNEADPEYREWIIKAYCCGMSKGSDKYGNFFPKNTLSRAETCQLFYNTINLK